MDFHAEKPGKQGAALEFIFQTSRDIIDVAELRDEYSVRRKNEFSDYDYLWFFVEKFPLSFRRKQGRRVKLTAETKRPLPELQILIDTEFFSRRRQVLANTIYDVTTGVMHSRKTHLPCCR